MNINANINGRYRFGGSVMPSPDLFDYSSRSGLNLVDALGGSNAAILGGKVAYFDGAAWLTLGTTNIGKVHDIELYMSPTITSSHVILGQSGYSASVYFTGTKFVYRINNAEYNLITAITAGIYKISRNEASLTLYKNGVSVATATISGGNNVDFVCDRIGQRAGGMYFVGYLSDLSISNSCKFPLNNQYCSITGVAATVNGVTFPLVTSYTPQSTIDALDSGYTQLSTGEQIPDPQFTLPVGAVNHEALGIHNLISSFVRFPVGSGMNRLDATKFNSTCTGSVYHNALDPYLFHISELTFDVLQTYLQTAYTNTIFVSIKTNYLNQLYIDRLFAFSSPLTGAALTYYLTQIGK